MLFNVTAVTLILSFCQMQLKPEFASIEETSNAVSEQSLSENDNSTSEENQDHYGGQSYEDHLGEQTYQQEGKVSDTFTQEEDHLKSYEQVPDTPPAFYEDRSEHANNQWQKESVHVGESIFSQTQLR